MDLDAFAWLLTDDGQAVLARAVEAAGQDGYDELAVQAQLRRTTTAPQRVATVIGQAELRRRAVVKFGDLAQRMYFTHDGLEQATRHSVATHRAGRLQAAAVTQSADRPGVRHRWRPGRLRARWHHHRRGGPRPGAGGGRPRQPRGARARRSCPGGRRDPGRPLAVRRRLRRPCPPRPAEAAPSTSTEWDAAVVVRRGPAAPRNACVKLAPGIPDTLWCPHGVEAEWVSDRGEVEGGSAAGRVVAGHGGAPRHGDRRGRPGAR